MKIVLVTALHQRHALAEIILKYYSNWDVIRVAVGSEGDATRALAERCGWHYVEHKNSPLTSKFTAVFEAARAFNPDAVLLIGSDDLLSKSILAYYQSNFTGNEVTLIGLKDIFFYNAITKKAIRHKGFIGTKSPFTIGCGRLFTRALLDKIDWKCWGEQTVERGLDITTSRILERMGIKETQLLMENVGIAVDIKTDIGLTNMKTFDFNCEPIHPNVFDFEFAEEMNEINNLNFTS